LERRSLRRGGPAVTSPDRAAESAPSEERVIAVRDSKDPDGPKLFFTVPEWKSFLDRIKAGDYDL
jgi:Domain of unknown function (DUF397)